MTFKICLGFIIHWGSEYRDYFGIQMVKKCWIIEGLSFHLRFKLQTSTSGIQMSCDFLPFEYQTQISVIQLIKRRSTESGYPIFRWSLIFSILLKSCFIFVAGVVLPTVWQPCRPIKFRQKKEEKATRNRQKKRGTNNTQIYKYLLRPFKIWEMAKN